MTTHYVFRKLKNENYNEDKIKQIIREFDKKKMPTTNDSTPFERLLEIVIAQRNNKGLNSTIADFLKKLLEIYPNLNESQIDWDHFNRQKSESDKLKLEETYNNVLGGRKSSDNQNVDEESLKEIKRLVEEFKPKSSLKSSSEKSFTVEEAIRDRKLIELEKKMSSKIVSNNAIFTFTETEGLLNLVRLNRRSVSPNQRIGSLIGPRCKDKSESTEILSRPTIDPRKAFSKQLSVVDGPRRGCSFKKSSDEKNNSTNGSESGSPNGEGKGCSRNQRPNSASLARSQSSINFSAQTNKIQ